MALGQWALARRHRPAPRPAGPGAPGGMLKIAVAIAPGEPDGAALEAALQLRDAAGGGEVAAITLASPEDREGLLSALAVGADRGLHLTHGSPGNVDPIATARALAAALAPQS